MKTEIIWFLSAAIIAFCAGIITGFKIGRRFGYEEAELDQALLDLKGMDHADARWCLTHKGQALTAPSVSSVPSVPSVSP